MAFWQGSFTPAALIAVVEALIDEGLLDRRIGKGLEEAVLGRVLADGRWQ